MSQLVRESATREQREQKLETRRPVKRVVGFAVVATAAAVLAALGAAALFAQPEANDRYSLKSPGGILFSDFRGYEDWSVVSSSRTDDRLKVIVGVSETLKLGRLGRG